MHAVLHVLSWLLSPIACIHSHQYSEMLERKILIAPAQYENAGDIAKALFLCRDKRGSAASGFDFVRRFRMNFKATRPRTSDDPAPSNDQCDVNAD